MKFSKLTGCFYPDDINYSSLPDDLVDVTGSEFELAMNRLAGETIDVSAGAIVIVPKPDLTLDELKSSKASEITLAFNNQLADGFYSSLNIKMDADIVGIQMLKSAYDLMLLVNQSILPVLTDYNNHPHYNVPMADVLTIIIENATNYQTLYAKKQALRSAAMAATSLVDVEAIEW